MTSVDRRNFIALGASAAVLPVASASVMESGPIARFESLDISKSVEDNLIGQYLMPVRVSVAVGAERPFSALHFSDAHVCMADAADMLSTGIRDLRLYEMRNNPATRRIGVGLGIGMFAVQSLAAAIAYARRKGMPLLNTGDIIDFRSEANYACVAHSLKGVDVFSSLGNHEGRGLHTDSLNPRSREESDVIRLRMEQSLRQPLIVHSRVINGVKFVAFDNCGLSHYYRNDQFARIKAEFEENLPTVLMCHMPPFSEELHEAKCENGRKSGLGRPAAHNLGAYYMMDRPFEKTGASEPLKRILDFLRGRKNLKAILCGHAHMEWHGFFGDGVPVHLAGPCFDGECLEVEFI